MALICKAICSKSMKRQATTQKTTRRVTLHDIARKAGVTVGTVSGVLSGKTKERRISEEAADRVWKAASELDYTPNLLVRSLQRGSTHILSFFNGFRSRDRHDVYMDSLTTGVERAGGRHGYNILVHCDFGVGPDATYQYINGGHADGLIFFKPLPADPLLPYLRRSNLPVVLVNSVDDEGVLPSVSDDWRSGIRRIASELVQLGHTKIAILTGRDQPGDARLRGAYLRTVLLEHGVTVPDKWVLPADAKDIAECNSTLRFLMNSGETAPTALFCWHDYLGYVILEECGMLGIAVPDDLTVVGYDGLRWPARTVHTLASVYVDLDGMGEAAVDMLVKLVEGDLVPTTDRVMPVTFDPGTTMAKPRTAIPGSL